MAAQYASRSKELVRRVWHVTEIDGTTTTQHPTSGTREWVYQRADGSEFVNLKARTPVRRVAGEAHVDCYAKKVQPISFTEVLRRTQGATPVALGGGLVAFVKKDP